MKITLAFQKQNSDKGDSGLIGNLVKFRTRSIYYHVEIIIGNFWVSSNYDTNGVKLKPLKPLNSNYDYIDVKVDESKLEEVMKYIENHKNSKYDLLGFFGIAFFMYFQDEDKLFCSEMVTEILELFNQQLIKGFVAHKTDPGMLFDTYKYLGFYSV